MNHNHIGGELRETFPEFEELFKVVEGSMGYLPNAYLGMAKRPELLKSFSGLIINLNMIIWIVNNIINVK